MKTGLPTHSLTHKGNSTMRIKLCNESPWGSKLASVKVPALMRKKVKSGIDWFDGIFGGQGLTPSMSVLFTGTPGAGKSTAMLMAADAYRKAGYSVCFNTAEESLFQVKIAAERLRLKGNFIVGGERNVPKLLELCDAYLAKQRGKAKRMVLIVDSLQCIDDGFYSNGHTNSKTPERSLEMLTSWAKETGNIVITIGQVTKSGELAGTQKLKHMIDAMIHIDVETRDKDLEGCRRLACHKNRFGGAGHTYWFDMEAKGLKLVAQQSL